METRSLFAGWATLLWHGAMGKRRIEIGIRASGHDCGGVVVVVNEIEEEKK
jgi:hypothetical protein